MNNTSNKVTRRTSIKLIETAIDGNWMRQLAFYYMVKFWFANGCIYNYRSRMSELAGQFNISTKTLYNYLNILRSNDMVCDHSNNLKLKSIRDFRINRKKCVILLKDDYSLWDIICLLYGKLIEQKAKNQAFKESVRRFGRGDRYNSNPCEIPFRPSLSYRTIAKLLKTSEYKAFKIVKNLNKLEVLKAVKQKPQLISNSYSALNYIEDLPGYRFNIGTRLLELYGNRIDFIQFPVYLKRITIRQYKQLINNHL
jgi:hypothetical protein